MPRGGRLLWSSELAAADLLHSRSVPRGNPQSHPLLLPLGPEREGRRAPERNRSCRIFWPSVRPTWPSRNARTAPRAVGTVDFTDTSSMFVRTVVEGLFGVQINVPDGWALVQPSFPTDWESASLRTVDAGYEYNRMGRAETLKVQTARPLRYRVRLRARSAEVLGVEVNGEKKGFNIQPGVGWAWVVVETETLEQATIRVEYGERKLPVTSSEPVGAVGEDYTFSVMNGRILEVRDPQGIIGQKQVSDGNCLVRFTHQALLAHVLRFGGRRSSPGLAPDRPGTACSAGNRQRAHDEWKVHVRGPE